MDCKKASCGIGSAVLCQVSNRVHFEQNPENNWYSTMFGGERKWPSEQRPMDEASVFDPCFILHRISGYTHAHHLNMFLCLKNLVIFIIILSERNQIK